MQRRRSKDGKKADGMKGQARPDGQTYNSKIKFAQQKRGQHGNKIGVIKAGQKARWHHNGFHMTR